MFARELVGKRSPCKPSPRATLRHLKTPPEEATLFDLDTCAWWHTQLSPNALGALREGWQGLFHRSILRPSAECKDLTSDAAAEAWSCDASVQFALGLPHDRQFLCARTLDNYRRRPREEAPAQVAADLAHLVDRFVQNA